MLSNSLLELHACFSIGEHKPITIILHDKSQVDILLRDLAGLLIEKEPNEWHGLGTIFNYKEI